MLIRIKHNDNRFDYVKANVLDLFIESKEIKSFKRSAGWVVLGVDPVRLTERTNPENYHIMTAS